MPSTQVAEIRAKKNEALKNKVKMLTNGSTITSSSSNTEVKATDTFITGCKTQQQLEEEAMLKEYDELVKKDENFGKKSKKYYKYPEDELLDEMDQHERDMNDMLKYLTEVEDLIKGQDLKSI